MIYTIERRKAHDGGTLTTFYQVRSYEGRSKLGCLVGGQTLVETKTKKEAKTYCDIHEIKWEE